MFFGNPAVQALIKSREEFDKPCVCLWDLLLDRAQLLLRATPSLSRERG